MSGKSHPPGFERLVDDARRKITECTVADVEARLRKGEVPNRDFILVDTREDREFAVARIPGARHLSKGVIERDIETAIPDLDADIVLYCGGGFRSALAAANLVAMGYRRVSSMDGGIRGWRDAGFAVDETPRDLET